MKKLLLFLCALFISISGAWAESKISKAVVGTYLFDSSNLALTVNKGGTATITPTDGAIVIHHSDLSTVGKGANNYDRTYAAVVMKVDMPTTAPGSFSQFINLKASSNNTGSIGLGVTTEGKLKGTWDGSEWNGNLVTTSDVTGEHTIVLLCNDGGTTIYVDDDETSANKSGLKSSTKWTDLRIESDYVPCVKSVYVLSGDQASNISDFFTELSNVVTVANGETKSVSENSATRFFVASGGTLTADVDYDADKIEVAGTIEIVSEKTLTVNVAWFDLTKITGEGNVTLDADATISGNKSTVATGKLIINEDKTLTLGTGQGQTNSIASFTSIELSGTIKHNNSVATLNNVTVPADKTGKIFAYDMGSEADGFNLAGTTTLNGNLTVCNKYNFQMKVDDLAGSGTWLICGTDDDAFNAEETASIEKAIINVAAATTFTGTINLNNVPTSNHPGTNTSQVTVQGNLVGCTLKKTTGDYFYYSGNNLNGTTLDGVVLNSTTARITTSNTVNIKNLAGCNLPNPSGNYGYVFIGSGGTINLYGTCDFTKKADGTTALSSNLGYGSSANIVVKEDATVTVGVAYNTKSSNDNASITVESGASLNTIGWTHADDVLYATNLTNNGTINLSTGRLTENYGISKVHTTFSGSGTLNIAKGAKLQVSSVPGTITGAGDVVLTSFPTSNTPAPTLSSWTGAIEFPNGSGGDLQAIFNAWGNTNSTIKLNNVTGGYLGKNGTVNPTLNILSGKTLTLNNGFSGSNSTLTKVTGAGTLDRRGWSGSNNHNLIITTLTGFTGTLSGTGHPIIVKKLVLENAPNADARLIKTTGTVTLNTEDPDGLYVGLQRTSAYSWETKTVEDVMGIYVSTFDQVQRYREIATAVVTPYFSYIGTGVGKYTISLGANDYTTTDDFTDAIAAWTTTEDYVVPTLTLNQPATGGFYRFHIGDDYMSNVAGGDNVRTTTTTADDASTIFYLNASNYLIAYADGYGFNFGYCKPTEPSKFNSFDFSESSTRCKYLIHSNPGTESNDYSNRYLTINESTSKLDAGQGAWTITEVTSLPITMHEVSGAYYATIKLPVAVTLPKGLFAYSATASDDVLTLTKVVENGVLAANQPVLLYSASNVTSLDISDETGTSAASNEFDGTIAAASVTANENYVLGANEGNVGFYKFSGNVMPGFKAYLPASATENVKFFSFSFEDAETAIRAIESENNGLEIYDMNGRRVQKVQKGLYIVNGKKVMYK